MSKLRPIEEVAIEEIVQQFEERMPLITSHGLLLEARLTPTNYEAMKHWLRSIIHQELQKARHNWLREEIVKLEGMKRKGLEQVEHDYITCYECGGYDECDCEGFNEALQTIIDRYQSELDQPISQDNK